MRIHDLREGRPAAVVLTALELEYRAVREHLTDLRLWEHPAGTLFEVGTIRGTAVRIALAVAGEGNQSSAVVAERACGAFSPRMLLLVGVAGALHTEVALGDVVVATRVYAYQGGKEDPSGFLVRPRAWDAPHHLEQRARYLTRTSWWRPLLSDVTNCGFRIHFKPVLAGEVVFDSPDSSWAELARRHYNDAVAIEMESAGVSLAARLNHALPVLTIRGIGDRADGAKAMCDSAGWPVVAAARAAAFALTLVACTESQSTPHADSTVAGNSLVPVRCTDPQAISCTDAWRRDAIVDHDRLFGADRLIENVRQAITSQPGPEIVSLFGEGGVGKTAVAYSAIADAATEQAFTRISWVSHIDRLALPHALNDPSGSGERILVVIDGLDAMPDAIPMIHDLRRRGLTRPHKLLVTTRWQLRAEALEATEFRVRPLAPADAIALIRHAGSEDGLLCSSDDSVLQRVIDVTEGNPYLLKIFIEEYLSSHLPLDVVLNSFLGTACVRTPFERSLSKLEHRFGGDAVKALLGAFCRGPLTYAELASALASQAHGGFPAILVDACRLALVTASGRRDPEGGTHRVYTIHHLLHRFACECRLPC